MARRVLQSLVTVSAALALATPFSCKTFDLPAETCNPQTLDAKRDPGQSDDDCSHCLEVSCCDTVGRCERQPRCAANVHDMQKCVLDWKLQGAREESNCAEQHLTGGREADEAYRCMRDSCGAQCGLPVCKVDKAALLIRNAKCDECFAGACCAPLNRCYESRACKLTLECIVGQCNNELGPLLEDGGPSGGAATGPGDIATLCDDRSQPLPGLPECVRTCLCTYQHNDQGLPPPDAAEGPVNLAFAVYACGKAAECGKVCTPGPDDGGAP